MWLAMPALGHLGIRILARGLHQVWKGLLSVILCLQRFSTQLKVVGIFLLLHHIANTGFRFNPFWLGVSLALTITSAVVSTSITALVLAVVPAARSPVPVAMGDQENLSDHADRMIQTVRRNPWLFLLVPGEDGIFFLPLLTIGISPVSAFMAAAIFALVHYRIKPNSALPGTFMIGFTNSMIVLPHGIMPMVLSHLILDAVAIALLFFFGKSLQAEPEA